RLTVDFRTPTEGRLLEHQKAVAIREGGSWIRFQLEANETLELPPNLLTLAYTFEVICIPHDLEGALQGRSSLARKGIATHITSERFDAGFIGYLTMEVLNQGLANVNIYPGMLFAAMTFHQLSSPATVPYYRKRSAQFSGQR
ncbi:MAG: dCTP deaminase, partial [Patescibacteria group bacterium]